MKNRHIIGIFVFLMAIAVAHTTAAQTYIFESEQQKTVILIPDSVKNPIATREQNITAASGKPVIISEFKNYEYSTLFSHMLCSETKNLSFSQDQKKNVLTQDKKCSDPSFAWELPIFFLYYVVFGFLIIRSKKDNVFGFVAVAAVVAIVIAATLDSIASIAVIIILIASIDIVVIVVSTKNSSRIVKIIWVILSNIGMIAISYVLNTYSFSILCIIGIATGYLVVKISSRKAQMVTI